MRARDGSEVGKSSGPRQDHFAERGMLLHRRPFVGIEFGRFVEDGITDPTACSSLEPPPIKGLRIAIGRHDSMKYEQLINISNNLTKTWLEISVYN